MLKPSARAVAIRAVALLSVVALVATGCASPGHTGAHSGSAPSASPSGSPSTGSDNRAAATVEAKRILATYRPPVGAKRLDHPPKGILTYPGLGTGSMPAYRVDDIAWYTVPRSSAEQLVKSTVRPPGSVSDGSESGDSNGGRGVEYGVAYSWSPVAGVLTERSLEVTATTVGNAAIVRVDGIASWQPPRDPKSLVPATATVVTVSYRPSQFASPAPTTEPPVTITDPAEVAKIVAIVNAGLVSPYGGAMPCPYDGGQLMTVVFRTQAGAPELAKAAISPSGCALVRMSVAGGADALLANGHAMAVAIGTVIGRPWPTS